LFYNGNKYKKMPRKNPEEFRQYQREQMRQRRAKVKAEKGVESPAVSQGDKSAGGGILTSELQPSPEQAAVLTSESPLVAQQQPEYVEGDIEGYHYKVSKEEYEKAVDTSTLTRMYLEKRGWVLWRCSLLDNEIICVIRDETITDYPSRYIAYTEQELKTLNQSSPEHMKYLHEVKKATQGRLLAKAPSGQLNLV